MMRDFPAIYDVSADTTFSQDDLGRWHFVNITGTRTLTLPTPVEGGWIGLYNYGTGTGTLKDDLATTIGTLRQYQWTQIPCLTNSSGIPKWPTGVMVVGLNGVLYACSDIVLRDSAKGVVWKDTTDGNFVRVQVTADALVTTDIGSSEPGGS